MAGSRKNIPNKTTAEMKNIFEKCEKSGKINWEKLFIALYKRGLKKGGDKAAQTVLEYKFGKASQSIDLTTLGEKISLNIVYGK